MLPEGKQGLTRSMRDPKLVLGDLDIILPEYKESEHRPHDNENSTSTSRYVYMTEWHDAHIVHVV